MYGCKSLNLGLFIKREKRKNKMKKIISKIVISLSFALLASLSFADPIWIDVRTTEEFQSDSIEGDLNIPLASITPETFTEMFGKDAEINLYCRSGNRAGQALELLEAAGFNNVNNLGGIGDVRELREMAEQSDSH
jgi:phage shock protein E